MKQRISMRTGDYDVALRINRLIDKSNKSAAQIARILGMGQTAIYEITNGRQLPNTVFLMRMSKYFGVSTDYILFGKE